MGECPLSVAAPGSGSDNGWTMVVVPAIHSEPNGARLVHHILILISITTTTIIITYHPPPSSMNIHFHHLSPSPHHAHH